jgi:hypothetical protein
MRVDLFTFQRIRSHILNISQHKVYQRIGLTILTWNLCPWVIYGGIPSSVAYSRRFG